MKITEEQNAMVLEDLETLLPVYNEFVQDFLERSVNLIRYFEKFPTIGLDNAKICQFLMKFKHFSPTRLTNQKLCNQHCDWLITASFISRGLLSRRPFSKNLSKTSDKNDKGCYKIGYLGKMRLKIGKNFRSTKPDLS